MRILAALLILGLAVAWPALADDLVLLRDDFDGSALDTAKWFVPIGSGTFFGRTQIRPPSEVLTVAGGVIRLQVDTFNPTAEEAGDSFWGSEIDTIETFSCSVVGHCGVVRRCSTSPMTCGRLWRSTKCW